MSLPILLENTSDRSAADNLAAFIDVCRQQASAFSSSIDWDDWHWQGFANFTKLGVGSRGVKTRDILDAQFIDFAKAYFAYQQSHHATGTKNETKALRTLEAALLKHASSASVQDIDLRALDEAASFASASYVPLAAYHCGRELERLARFLSAKKLTARHLSTWKSSIRKPRDVNIQTGPQARAHREKKLPGEEQLQALAMIFSNCPSDPKDIFTTSTFALTMCAPSRGTEILQLPVDCEIEEQGGDRTIRYGWRFFAGKGFEGDIKWVTKPMDEIAKEAMKRLRALTNDARQLANWIEKTPGRFFRHADCPEVDDYEPLTSEQAAAALGIESLKIAGLSERRGAYTLNTLWKYVIDRQPLDFPWLNKKTKLKYSNALFCMTANMLHATRGTSPVLLWAPDINVFNSDLSPRDSPAVNGAHRSIFDRWGFTSAGGNRLKLTSHQARHLLNTIADRGGLSQEQLAQWAGRADPKQNRVYIHRSEFEMAAVAQSVDSSLSFLGPQESIVVHKPITSEELKSLERGPIHVTEFGVCLHDWVFVPCEKYRDCLNCQEHVCIKDNGARLERLQARLSEVKKDYEAACDAINEGLAGADRWFESLSKDLVRLRQLVHLLADPSLPEGTRIKLEEETDFSHVARALRSNSSDSLETKNRQQLSPGTHAGGANG